MDLRRWSLLIVGINLFWKISCLSWWESPTSLRLIKNMDKKETMEHDGLFHPEKELSANSYLETNKVKIL